MLEDIKLVLRHHSAELEGPAENSTAYKTCTLHHCLLLGGSFLALDHQLSGVVFWPCGVSSPCRLSPKKKKVWPSDFSRRSDCHAAHTNAVAEPKFRGYHR